MNRDPASLGVFSHLRRSTSLRPVECIEFYSLSTPSTDSNQSSIPAILAILAIFGDSSKLNLLPPLLPKHRARGIKASAVRLVGALSSSDAQQGHHPRTIRNVQ